MPTSGPLAVQRRGVVRRHEDAQQVVGGDHFGVVGDLDDFRVAGPAAAHFAIGGVGQVAARVARLDLDDAVQVLEDGLDAPETASGDVEEAVLFGVVGGLHRRRLFHKKPSQGTHGECRKRSEHTDHFHHSRHVHPT